MSDAITLAEARTHLSAARAALDRALTAQGYSLGSLQVQRATVPDLQKNVDHWARIVREKTHAASGVKNPGFLVPSWD